MSDRRWRDPAWQAALVNGLLIVLVPAAWMAYADYTFTGTRPAQPTVLSSVRYAWPVITSGLPVAALVFWRTLAHARRYLVGKHAVRRGLLESAAIAAAFGLFTMLSMTAATWSRESAPLVAAYIAVYVAIAAIVGLLVGFALAGTALLVLRLGRLETTPS